MPWTHRPHKGGPYSREDAAPMWNREHEADGLLVLVGESVGIEITIQYVIRMSNEKGEEKAQYGFADILSHFLF